MADPKANEAQGYHQFIGETMVQVATDDGEDSVRETYEHGSFEVYWSNGETPNEPLVSKKQPNFPPGWYWWACFPGCMPDGEPSGPFATSQEAYDNAQEGA